MANFITVLTGLNQGADFITKVANIFRTVSVLKDTSFKSNLDYIVLNATKEVTVYCNGHGVITYTYDFYVINPENFTYFDRKLNIEDACRDSKFPSLKNMLNCDKKDRFHDYGFWYSCTNDCVHNIKEFYWSDNNHSKENPTSKNNTKELRWRFNMDTSKMKKGGVYRLTYAISVPGIFPITNGKYDSSIDIINTNQMSSSFKMEHYMRSIKYIVSFENGIEFETTPQGEFSIDSHSNRDENTNVKSQLIQNVFYNKYEFVTNKHKQSGDICIKWAVV